MANYTDSAGFNGKKIALAVVIAASIAIPAEGLRDKWYADPGQGIVTVCYGSTNNVDKQKTYTKDQCMALLSKEMGDAIRTVDSCNPNLPLGVLAAFGDAVYNLGPTIACNSSRSTAAALLMAKDYMGACKQLIRWDKAWVLGAFRPLPGLTKRRAREMEICLKDAA